ncbi:hypothetical protein AB1Y20_010321 [Prymnesium parvum]|uniref:Uncharacterized protein n=1 Tax=Prymnesium parvum TaxID=97485 RepID=A0AB34K8L4_PRYPA
MRAPPAANRQAGNRRSSRGAVEEETDLATKVALLEMKLQEKETEHDELLHHFRRLEVQRACERRKNEELTSTIACLEAKVAKLAAGPTRADKSIDSEPTMSLRAAELAAHVQKLYEPSDLPTLFTDESLKIYARLSREHYAELLGKAMNARVSSARTNSLADALPFLDLDDLRRACARTYAQEVSPAADLDLQVDPDDDADEDGEDSRLEEGAEPAVVVGVAASPVTASLVGLLGAD